MKPKALDLFCGAGGATMGLMRAGFHVTGVDINAQTRYVGDCFRITDALRYPLEGFDFIWASPPCQKYSIACLNKTLAGENHHPDLVPLVRDRLEQQVAPWAMENVPGAPMTRGRSIRLCGSLFDLRLVRHRIIEANFPLPLVSSCAHVKIPVTVTGGGTPSWARRTNGGKAFSEKEKREAMGIDWMNRYELALSVPPAYSEFIGRWAQKVLTFGEGGLK